MIRFCIIGILLFFVSCAPASISSYDFALPSNPQLFWLAMPQDFKSFVVSFVRKFDPKFTNAFVSSELSVKGNNIHEITLNRRVYVDIDNEPYRLTIFVTWAVNSSDSTSFILMNEENTSSLDFPVGTLAFALNEALIKALDVNFKRQSN